MGLLTKDQILAADDAIWEEMDVPEWGGKVRISVMSGQSRDRYEASLYKDRDSDAAFDNLRARFLSYCLINEEGDLIFSVSDMIELGRKNGQVIDRVYTKASELNGTSVEEMEEIAKN